jgi:uncharacterized membrane protein
MNKQAFLAGLEKELREKQVADLGDIISEYEQHFAYKLADGTARGNCREAWKP